MTTPPNLCPFCGATTQPRARFCPNCGRSLIQAVPEVAVPVTQRLQIEQETLNLGALVNVVESGVRYWQQQLAAADTVTRAQAAVAIEQLGQILHSLSQQIALGRTDVRITTRLPALRVYDIACPRCGGGNRREARFCQRCAAPLSGTLPKDSAMVPVPPLRFQIAARTHIGRVRKMNQDSVAARAVALPDGVLAQLCLVADGMGGAKAGDRASQLTVAAVQQHLDASLRRATPTSDAEWQAALRDAVAAANRQVYRESRQQSDLRGMGTTLTMALLVGERLHLASVGDSRAYLINAQGVTVDHANVAQLTSDHTLVARLVDIGQITPEEARSHPQRNLLYRSIGTDPTVEVDTRSEAIEADDMIVLCSDGLFGFVRDDELARIVLEHTNLEAACDILITLANERGGSDNISVVIVRVGR